MGMSLVVVALTSLLKLQNTRAGIVTKNQTLPMKIESLQTLRMKIQICRMVELGPQIVRALCLTLLHPRLAFFVTDDMDGDRVVLAHIKNYLQKDRMWQVSLKASGTHVRIPDVMKKYRTIHRIIHELAGTMIDNGHIISQVSRFSYTQGCHDNSSWDMM